MLGWLIDEAVLGHADHVIVKLNDYDLYALDRPAASMLAVFEMAVVVVLVIVGGGVGVGVGVGDAAASRS